MSFWYPYEPGERVFGVTPLTPAMPQPFQPGAFLNQFEGTPPTHVFATIYYPDLFSAPSAAGNPLNIARGPFRSRCTPTRTGGALKRISAPIRRVSTTPASARCCALSLVRLRVRGARFELVDG
jgi:hypothetical protein